MPRRDRVACLLCHLWVLVIEHVMLSVMRVALVVTGGVDESARERVVPALLWLVERLARRHDVHVFALHYHRNPRSYPLLGATVHDLGRVDGPPGFRRLRVTARLRHAVAAHGPFDILHAYLGMPRSEEHTSELQSLR